MRSRAEEMDLTPFHTPSMQLKSAKRLLKDDEMRLVTFKSVYENQVERTAAQRSWVAQLEGKER